MKCTNCGYENGWVPEKFECGCGAWDCDIDYDQDASVD